MLIWCPYCSAGFYVPVQIGVKCFNKSFASYEGKNRINLKLTAGTLKK